MKIPSTFHVGQKVTVKAYTDCFQVFHPAITGMTIVEMEYVPTESIAAYYRLKAIGTGDIKYFKAADRFFEPACDYCDVIQSATGTRNCPIHSAVAEVSR